MKITLKHYDSAKYLMDKLNNGDLDATKMETFLILFYGIDKRHTIKSMSYMDIFAEFEKVTKAMSKHLESYGKHPAKHLQINGKQYDLVEFGSQTIGWMRDASEVNEHTPAYILACLGYVPEGTYYGEMDDNGKLLYSFEDMREEFNEHFPLVEFFKLQSFFLKRLRKSLWRLEGQIRGRMWAERKLEQLKKLRKKSKILGLD